MASILDYRNYIPLAITVTCFSLGRRLFSWHDELNLVQTMHQTELPLHIEAHMVDSKEINHLGFLTDGLLWFCHKCIEWISRTIGFFFKTLLASFINHKLTPKTTFGELFKVFGNKIKNIFWHVLSLSFKELIKQIWNVLSSPIFICSVLTLGNIWWLYKAKFINKDVHTIDESPLPSSTTISTTKENDAKKENKTLVSKPLLPQYMFGKIDFDGNFETIFKKINAGMQSRKFNAKNLWKAIMDRTDDPNHPRAADLSRAMLDTERILLSTGELNRLMIQLWTEKEDREQKSQAQLKALCHWPNIYTAKDLEQFLEYWLDSGIFLSTVKGETTFKFLTELGPFMFFQHKDTLEKWLQETGGDLLSLFYKIRNLEDFSQILPAETPKTSNGPFSKNGIYPMNFKHRKKKQNNQHRKKKQNNQLASSKGKSAYLEKETETLILYNLQYTMHVY